MPLRLYISHASDDQASVNRLRDELKAKEFQVFLCEDLPPGSDWQKEMDRELKQADVFIYCLSSASVARPGLYNDELKAARARYRTEGERAILVVPLRLEPCVIPAEIRDFMALDLFPADGLTRLVEVLRSRTQTASRHVFLLHGIKTRGKWQKDFSPLLSAQGLVPIPLDFGNFGARHLVWPPARKKKRQWLLEEYQKECARLRCESPSIVAHSFGCYLVASLLKKYPQVRFDRIIFCGSIVHPSYPWTDIAARGQVKSVLNQHGGADFWAWVVKWAVEDAGDSGSSGFGQACAILQQQNHPEFEHSDYFFDLNYNQNWIPFLRGDPLPAGTTNPYVRPPPPNWRFRSLVAIVLFMCVAALVLSGWYYWRSSEKRVHAEPHLGASSTSALQVFSGFVQDDHGDPLPGVTIIAPTLNLPPQTTDASGRFSFQVDLATGTHFRLIFQKPGFETYTADPASGDTGFNITLHQALGKRSQ
jgi:pimeloyl-ACP methyl ester carboxylesterase